jgi:hypothetical protein
MCGTEHTLSAHVTRFLVVLFLLGRLGLVSLGLHGKFTLSIYGRIIVTNNRTCRWHTCAKTCRPRQHNLPYGTSVVVIEI